MLLFTIWLLLGLQLGCLFYCIVEDQSPLDILYGFSIWGCIPIAILSLI